MRDWLTVIIVLLIIVILVDGVRRMRLARRDRIRVSRNVYKAQTTREDPKADLYTSELPNGGARVVAHRDHPYVATRQQTAKNQRKPEQTSLNLDEAVPMLMESVTEDALLKNDRSAETTSDSFSRSTAAPVYNPGRAAARDERIEPTFSSEPSAAVSENDYEHDFDQPDYPRARAPATAYDEDDALLDEDPEEENGSARTDFGDEDDCEDYRSDEEDADYEEDDSDYEDENNYDEDEEDYREPEPQSVAIAAERPQSEPEEVLIINVMANKGETFRGDELLDILLKCGMRYGDMDIFHRYSDSKGDGALLFSMANMVKPGTFDLDAMEQFDTPGVSLFMTLPLKADSMQSFELMVDTARTIAETLNGELKDEQRSVMTRQTVEHCRERIRDFERRRLFSRQR